MDTFGLEWNKMWVELLKKLAKANPGYSIASNVLGAVQ